MGIDWSDEAEEDKEFWEKHDPKMIYRIDKLIANILATPFSGIGKPELLKNNLRGQWSRRITNEHRLTYRCDGESVYIIRCKGHYE